MFECKDNFKKSLRYINSCHSNIQFPSEEEYNNKLSFLDISVTRTESKLVMSFY